METLLNKTEVCELLKISRPTLDRIVAAGELEALRIRGQVRFSPSALQQYLSGCREQRPPARPKAPGTKNEPPKRGRPKGSRKAAEEYYYPGMRVV